ncbi:MAG: alkyldihydroxyacetonephosphate synthase [Solirubrobacteraceae bacterium]|nr:alkyldihydroxyacetonephosphate synthase [Solirubrobacteraceae bacterium]
MASGDMRWWGWGDPDRAPSLSGAALELLGEEVGLAAGPRAPVELAAVRIAAPALRPAAARVLAAAAGPEGIVGDHPARVLHAGGKGYPDLVRMRAGTPEGAPDAVVLAQSDEQVGAVLSACARAGVAVVPFGGGTSVVGGVAPVRGRHHAVIALDLRGLHGVRAVDRESLTVRVGAGTRGPALEAELAAHGLTLGHFPQSFEYVTVGGCAATRSAGQASTGYGRMDELVRGLRLRAPAGELAVAALPASAAGPSLRELVVGSEGILGVITELALRVRPRPEATHYEGMFFEGFEQGAQGLRLVAQERRAPDIARLSDEEETRLSLALAGEGGIKGLAGRGYIRARGYGGGCLAILGWEGEVEDVGRRRTDSLTLLRRAGGLPLGGGPGSAWAAGRFAAPYLRDELLGHGVMVETLETAAQWSDLHRLRAAVTEALRASLIERGTPPLVLCHVSHLYETGASLYFTFLARQEEGSEIDQWRAAKTAAGEAIMANAGTITHHHAVGRDHAPWLAQEIGVLGVDLLAAVKHRLDPTGIMNPGKLL